MKTCVIVDAYRFSKDYLHYLNKKNIRCIHIQSTPAPIFELKKSSTYDPNAYIDNIVYDGALPALVSQLKKYRPDAIIAGTEPGVRLADELSYALNVKNNALILSEARRNKHTMLTALNAAGVRHMKYFKTNNINAARHWVKENTGYPVVIKPLESAGTEDVYICESKEELENNFSNILRKTNCLGLPNHSVLVQEFLQGTEYMINSVSLHGAHYFTDIWVCNKRHLKNHGMIYDREELLDSKNDTHHQIITYLWDVLDALGIKFGAAHSEIILTEQGPILIEVGARVGGNVNCISHTECLGKNQLELTVDAYVDEKTFYQKTQSHYSVLKNAMTVLLSTQQEGIIQSIPLLDKIKSCRSLYWYHLNVAPGDYLKKTHDLFSSPGKVILLHEDKAILRQDYTELMAAIPQGFEIQSSSPTPSRQCMESNLP